MQDSGARQVIDREVAKRQQHRTLMGVVSVTKHPVINPPRIVATIRLQDGTSHDLTQDAWGKRNYELSVNLSYRGDELYCVSPPIPGQRLVLVGSEAGARRI